MSALARANGWRGFDGLGERVKGGTAYCCDGEAHAMGCGDYVTVSRPWTKVGMKSSGWLVTYGRCDDGDPGDDGKGNDTDVVLTFCPACAAVIRAQEAARVGGGS